MMLISERGLTLIKEFEGFSARAYICPAGKGTIGYGHVLADGEIYPNGVSSQKAGALLLQDVGEAERAVCRLAGCDLSQGQFDALVSFVFNLGAGALARSTLLRKLNAGDYAGAAKEFLRWDKAGGKKLAGLSRRRMAEMMMFQQ
ncbi:MAG: lysozyme [Alphaproteobacteria bacterium]|nr:lysozyme [Alphaproteobacteria bacterium]